MHILTRRLTISCETIWVLGPIGQASTFNHRVFCRQTIIGGNYGLLNTTSFIANPDFYGYTNSSKLNCYFNDKIDWKFLLTPYLLPCFHHQGTFMAPSNGKQYMCLLPIMMVLHF